MNAPPPLLSAERVDAGWGRAAVVSGVTFDVRRGEILALVGPNGSGKTTLLRAVLGLSRPLSGVLRRSDAWRAGYVPQREDATPLLRFRAREVVAMAVAGKARAERAKHADAALEAVGCSAFAGRVYRDLSGGQRQRVLLARALASDPSVLVLDEPTNGLDLAAERDLLKVVRRLVAERDLACLLVTHALDVAASLAHRAGLFADGRVVFGDVADLLSEESLTRIYGPGVRLPAAGGVR